MGRSLFFVAQLVVRAERGKVVAFSERGIVEDDIEDIVQFAIPSKDRLTNVDEFRGAGADASDGRQPPDLPSPSLAVPRDALSCGCGPRRTSAPAARLSKFQDGTDANWKVGGQGPYLGREGIMGQEASLFCDVAAKRGDPTTSPGRRYAAR